MSWNKNAFSYLMWLVYTIIAGGALAGISIIFCTGAGLDMYLGVFFAALFLAIAGGIVYILHRLEPKLSSFASENHRILLAAEAMWVLAFFALGLVLRLKCVNIAGQTSEYYEAAKVVEGQHIPRILHGATYFYVQILHIALKLLGNRIMVGIWLQVALQFIAFFVLYFLIRKLAGVISALVSLGFFMCAPYLVQKALVLSPEMLYFVIFMAAAALITIWCSGALKGKDFFLAGAVAALCFYIDMSGGLLLIFAFSLIFCCRDQAGTGKKTAAVVSCLGGAVIGLFAGIFLDASVSGKTVQRVALAWASLYQPEEFHLQEIKLQQDSVLEYLVLFASMAFGIFSFWRHRRRERIAMGTLALCVVTAAECFGIFSEEMPGCFYIYLILTLLAGMSMGQCFPEKGIKQVENNEAGRVGLDEEPEMPDSGDMGSEAATASMERPTEGQSMEAPYASGVSGQRMEELEETGFLDEDDEEPEPELPVQPVKKEIQYIENPLPLPKKHVKRVMDYSLQQIAAEDDFDYAVADDDDFDI